jgi:hypothetical protein
MYHNQILVSKYYSPGKETEVPQEVTELRSKARESTRPI